VDEQEKAMTSQGFWDDNERAQKTLQSNKMMKEEIEGFERLESSY